MLHTYVTRLVSKYIYIYILTREIPAFQRPFGKPPPSASVKEKKNWGAGGAPVGPSAYAALGGEKKKLGRLRRPKSQIQNALLRGRQVDPILKIQKAPFKTVVPTHIQNFSTLAQLESV